MFDVDRLEAAVAALPTNAWSTRSVATATNATHGYRTAPLVVAGRRQPHTDPFGFVLDQFAPVYSAWVSDLEAGGYIRPHVDAGPHRERWHVPVTPAGTTSGLDAHAGEPARFEHWEPHEVTNPTDRRRVHVVIDRDVVVRAEATLFREVETCSG